MKTPYDDREDLGDLPRRLLADAWRRGHRARMERKPFRCPLSSYVPGCVRAWEDGWRTANEQLEAQRKRELEKRVPDIRSQDPPIRPR